ncbi:TIGR03619 family F420-dependent LLM class oxidoreductase [Nocardia miyunensis]|uniref:TIGR03619 family F420-dependent LLM class oxidoreductase n=1 Tax=Nocardia miyunensis TaxID=282684 RepID=UPI0008298322|nr:TIGR03619 family F420-dependent LLM class oxidoreductase [Nocardia miyunensis]
MTAKPKLGIYLSGFAYGPDRFPLLLEHARRADELGIDAITLSSHVVMALDEEPVNQDKRYRSLADLRRVRETYPPDKPMLHPPRNVPWLEVFTTMGAIAAVTSRAELYTAMAIPPLHPAVLFAKQAATLDWLAQGRLRLGVTASWIEGEYRALDRDFEQRGQVLDDTIAACQALWAHTGSNEPVAFSSKTVNFEDIFFEPKPPSPQGIPVYFAGPFSKRTVRRVATMGQGWLPWLVPPEQFPEAIRTVKEATADAGRDPSDLVFQLNVPSIGADGKPAKMWTRADVERSFERVPELAKTGANLFIAPLYNFHDEPEEGLAALEHIAEVWNKLDFDS